MTLDELKTALDTGRQIWNADYLQWYWRAVRGGAVIVCGTCLNETCEFSFDSVEALWEFTQGGASLRVAKS